MADKNRDPPEAYSRMNPTTIAIEEAQTDIKEAAKRAVLNADDEYTYMGKVGEILKKRLAHVRSPTLRDSALVSLLRFAQKQYAEELKLMKLYVEWFRMVTEAKLKGLPQANAYYRAVIKEVGNVKDSIGFKLETFNGAPVRVINNPTLRSDTMPDYGVDPSAYNNALPLKELHEMYLTRVEDVRLSLIDAGAVDDGGLTLRNIAEMTTRYDHQNKMIADLREKDVKLVYIEPHSNCSKRCEKYQVGGSLHPSGLYSLNGETGVTAVDHVPYLPLEFATQNPIDQYTTKSGKVYQNGCILGYNCRHRLIPYKPNTQPIPIPKRVIENRRRVEMTQRAMEREIRHLRGSLIQATSLKDINGIKKAIATAEKNYKAFSIKNNAAYFIRRTEIF